MTGKDPCRACGRPIEVWLCAQWCDACLDECAETGEKAADFIARKQAERSRSYTEEQADVINATGA